MFYYNTYVFNIFPTEISKLIYTFITHPFTESRYQLFTSIKHNEKTISTDVIMILKQLKMNQYVFPSMDYAHMTHQERFEFDSYHSQVDELHNEEMVYHKQLSYNSDMVILPRHRHKLSKIIKNPYSSDSDEENFNQYPSYCYANEKILFIINQDIWY